MRDIKEDKMLRRINLRYRTVNQDLEELIEAGVRFSDEPISPLAIINAKKILRRLNGKNKS
jgi:hypothetical protein